LLTEPFFFDKITGREYLQLLCNARGVAVGNLDERNIFNLPLNQYAGTYSTGMKKKLALTAILLQQNQYFILDEPYNGVDIQSNLVITEIIHQLKSLGKTVLLSSHIFSTLSETCDEIHLLRNGKFIMQAGKNDFKQIENEMKAGSVGDKLERLLLS
jgi:ABC-2 type transport system ATP-binding protein